MLSALSVEVEGFKFQYQHDLRGSSTCMHMLKFGDLVFVLFRFRQQQNDLNMWCGQIIHRPIDFKSERLSKQYVCCDDEWQRLGQSGVGISQTKISFNYIRTVVSRVTQQQTTGFNLISARDEVSPPLPTPTPVTTHFKFFLDQASP